MTKYYRYHRNNGHTTNECKALQEKIEEFVRVGHFRCFIHRDERPHPSWFDHIYPPRSSYHDRRLTQPTSHDPQPTRTNVTSSDPPLRDTINTISGGIASGGSTSSARKKHLRQLHSINHITHSHHKRRIPPIIFTDGDFHGVDHEQDNPMVIVVELENYAVKKVIIDQGSSVDILYWTTY